MNIEDNTVPTARKSEHTEMAIKKLSVNAVYEKKKHYNAADRILRYHFWLGFPSVVISIVLGTSLIGGLATQWPECSKWFGAILAAIVAVLTGLQTFFNFTPKAEQHRKIASRYLSVGKECDRILAYHKDGAISPNILREQFEATVKQYTTICEDSGSFPTKYCDYKKAKSGFQNGEERYENFELDIDDE